MKTNTKTTYMMTVKILNEHDYRAALERMEIIFDAKSGTRESDEADLLAAMIDEFEKENYPIH
ncbi:hypothetical protein [Dyadobacter chenhuakuii]|uniref:HTH-type transcriptional regulator/antitoxin HigA n=1 Tax=Dyadobacter chenhuakuii TaxID=2909339 RepID=A0ABY4XND3_9BACT|nr:hypothetical protein [Dyadobacter chenhuakuii]MCF2494912.1 hypothetical protein [Dyadobacter chenhuakuii]USJ31771.1 hypothetical protein NFI80_03325 [Dyadobacter chenhuakuii]